MNRIAPTAGALFAAAMLIALLITAAPATASPPGASVVLDQPDGFTDPFTGAGNHSQLGSRRAVSADGRYVAFLSESDGLSAAADDRVQNVYRKDRVSGDVVLVSVAPDGRGADADSSGPQISADGNRVAFVSTATNLDPGAADGQRYAFVRDVPSNRTILASRTTGAAGAPVRSWGAALSGDGGTVAFTTDAPLDPQDKNARVDVYARRLAADETLLVSRRDGAAGAPADRDAYDPSVDHDGSRIAFVCDGSLETADANAVPDVYRRTLTTALTELVSGNDADGKAGNGTSGQPSISASGDAVAFVSQASDLDAQASDDTMGRPDVFVAIGGDQRQLSPIASGHAERAVSSPSIAGSPGPVRVAFYTLLAADPTKSQVVVYTVSTGQVQIASATPANQPGGENSWLPSLSADGRVVAFITEADLGAASGGDYRDVVARDLEAGRTQLVSAPAAGPLPEDLASVGFGEGGGQLSPDARFAAFGAEHDGLGTADRREHVFLRDARTGRTVLVDRTDGADGVPSAGATGGSASGDGRIVAFVTTSPLAAADTNGEQDVYVRDTVDGTTRLISRTPAGAAGNEASGGPSVSADGRRIAFHTYANDLGGDGNPERDVYVADVGTGALQLASRADGAANGASYGPALSADGSRVAFTSFATNLDPADTDASSDVYVRDLAGGTTLASRRNDGSKANASSLRPAISADGRQVAFQSEAPLADDADLFDDVYVRDLAAGTTALVSRAAGAAGIKGNASSERPSISADGTAVAFRSYASNLGGEEGGAYVRRLDDATTTPMGSGRPAGLSADGSCLMMATDSAALVRSSPDHERVLLRAVRERCELPELPIGTPPGSPQPGPTGPVAQGGAPQLSALSLTRRRFRVGKARAATTSAVRRGTVVRFRLDRPAAVSLAVRQRVGRRSVARGTLRRTGRAGRNRVAFSGRVARRTLRPGRYVLVARARAAGGISAPRRVAFRIVPAGR